jgi:hypothetical protein
MWSHPWYNSRLSPLVLELILVTEHNKFIFLSADFMPAQSTLPPPSPTHSPHSTPTPPSSQNKRDVSSPSKKSVYNEVEKIENFNPNSRGFKALFWHTLKNNFKSLILKFLRCTVHRNIHIIVHFYQKRVTCFNFPFTNFLIWKSYFETRLFYNFSLALLRKQFV